MIGPEQNIPRYFIIHGHFYQPPRENPWTDHIEPQDSAAPYHDWNERIYYECYRPNAHSRILDTSGMIVDIHNNFRFLSFNFGPTLFNWIEKKHPGLAQRIVEADRESCLRLEGHGNALAQVYNHIILPLASRRDQLTQIRWGKAHFRSRFGREPEGMWLSETAINAETVRCLIEEGVKFVILSPTQADAVRGIGEDDSAWRLNEHSPIDTRRAYRIRLPEGDSAGGHLDAFFFDEELSRSTSFGNLLTDASVLGRRLLSCFDPAGTDPQAAILATDGETFGHHKPYGDMCLAYLYNRVAAEQGLTPVSFGFFLAKHPPRHEVRLRNADADGCAWSCAHGTGRWARDCGCHTGGYPEWNQQWRTPLRAALNKLQSRIDRAFAARLGSKVDDPWRLRDDYVLLKDRIEHDGISALLTAHGAGAETPALYEQARRLLSAQLYMLYAYTSCGWFFSDISGIETVQNLQYACRAAQLGLQGRERDTALEEFLQILSTAVSNLPDRTGRSICEHYAVPLMRNMELVAFAAAATVPTPKHRPKDRLLIDGYEAVVSAKRAGEGTKAKGGRRYEVTVARETTGERGVFEVTLIGRRVLGMRAIVKPLRGAGKDRTVELSTTDLFVDSRHKLTEAAIQKLRIRLDKLYRGWMTDNEETISALASLHIALPDSLRWPATHTLNFEWSRLLLLLEKPGRENDVYQELLPIWKRARSLGIKLDSAGVGRHLEELLRRDILSLIKELNETTCERIRTLLNIAERFELGLTKNRIEDAFFQLLCGPVARLYERHTQGKIGEEKTILLHTLGLARRLNFATDRFPLS